MLPLLKSVKFSVAGKRHAQVQQTEHGVIKEIDNLLQRCAKGFISKILLLNTLCGLSAAQHDCMVSLVLFKPAVQ